MGAKSYKNDENLIVNSMPIIISGSGGSGTRVVAEILIRSGIFLGQDLNKSSDNLLFTYFFKRPKRFIKDFNRNNPKHKKLYALHERLLFGYPSLNIEEVVLVMKAGLDHTFYEEYYNWIWVIKRWGKMIRSKHQRCQFYWGWKEPHNLFHLRGINSYYPDAKYIHVLRHGLDMVYSNNQQQLRNWGLCFQIDPDDLTPRTRFEFWYRLNRQTIITAQKLFTDRLLIVKLEELILQKEDTMQKIFNFIGLDTKTIPPDVWNIPKLPNSYNRYHDFELDWIDAEVKLKLSKFGYSLRM